MSYEFSLGAFFVGLLLLAVGVAFVRFHQWVADNFGGGVGSYEKFKLYAFLTCIFGFIVMLNIHTIFLEWFVDLIFRRS